YLGDAHFPYATASGRQHRHDRSVGPHFVAHAGDFAQLVVQQSAQRVEILVLDVQVERIVDVANTHPRVEHRFVVVDLFDHGFFDVVLVADLADDLFDQVFDGDEPGRATVLVDHDGHVDAAFLHLVQ